MEASKMVTFVETNNASGEFRDGKILISINDDPASFTDHGFSEGHVGTDPIRAQSLNRLDGMLQDNDARISNAYYMYKCPSFPGLDRVMSASARSISITHLETDSISPRVSTTTISQDLEDERLNFSILGLDDFMQPARSASARFTKTRTVPQSHAGVNLDSFVSYGPNSVTLTELRKGIKVCRSTSCPTVEYARRAVAGPGGAIFYRRKVGVDPSPSQQQPVRSNQPQSGIGDVDLAGEEVNDLPFELWNAYPDFIPEQIIDGQLPSSVSILDNGYVNIQRVTKQSSAVPITTTTTTTCDKTLVTYSRDASSAPSRYTLTSFSCPPSDVHTSTNRPRHVLTSSALLYRERELVTRGDAATLIQDVCTAAPKDLVHHVIADHVIADHDYRLRAPQHVVQIKCLRWLNSLDNDC